jgi:hypothetical protein
MRTIGFLALLLWTGVAQAQKAPTIEDIAKRVIQQMSEGQFDEASEALSPGLKSIQTPSSLMAHWKDLTDKNGAFAGIGGTRREHKGMRDSVYVRCKFEKGAVEIKAAFDRDNTIMGISFGPPQTPRNRKPKPH